MCFPILTDWFPLTTQSDINIKIYEIYIKYFIKTEIMVNFVILIIFYNRELAIENFRKT